MVLINLQTIISFCQGARVWRMDGQTDSHKGDSNTVRMHSQSRGKNDPIYGHA